MAECETPATEGATWQTTQITNTGANELSSVDKDEQHHPSQTIDVTAQNPTDKETQTKIDQTDAAVQTDSPTQAKDK